MYKKLTHAVVKIITLTMFLSLNVIADPPASLSVPHHTTLAVEDIDAVKAQMSAVLGIEWRDETTTTTTVNFIGQGNEEITFRRVYSKPGQPFIELVEADPAIGPWAATETSSSGYIGYRVENVPEAGAPLHASNMVMVAHVANQFAIYEGIGGVLVEIVDDALAPATSESYTPQAAIDLGVPHHLGWSVDSSNRASVKEQFTEAFGYDWQTESAFLNTPFFYSEDSSASADGIYTTDVFIARSVPNGPFVEFETGEFDLDPSACSPSQDPCELSPFNSTDTTSIFQPGVWGVASEDVEDLIDQWELAGLTLIMSFAFAENSPPVLAYYRGAGGILYEFNDEILLGSP